MTLAAIAQLLQTALLLLTMAQGPNVPPALKTQAVNVANQAIVAATQVLGGKVPTGTSSGSFVQTSGGTSVSSTQSVATYTPPPVTASAPTVSAQSSQQSGWDYDLMHKCAKTTGSPGDTNYFAVTDGCVSGKHWLIANQSEKDAVSGSAPGPTNRSFPINTSGSPLSMQWIPHTSTLGTNWSVNLKVDQHTYPHPNGSGYFTYLGMMDHVDVNGGPLPTPLKLNAHHAISYDQWTPGADDGARMLVGAQFWWGGKAHILEINLASSQWGDAHSDPKAILVNSNWYGNGSAEFVALEGAAWGLSIPTGANTTIDIPWAQILTEVLAKGWFTPIGSQGSVTQAVYIGTEVKNQAVGNLWQTDFRVESK